jgi:tRNA 2-selenouridine synthase
MAIQKLTISEFVTRAKALPVLDVRSPGEYSHAQVPGAYSLPLFTDEERKVVGTAYKRQSRQAAIKIGLVYFGVKMKSMVEEAERIVAGFSYVDPGQKELATNGQQATGSILVHCWRGGMRSAAVAWLLDLYGFKVYTLVGGYKAYRQWVREQFEKPSTLYVLGGYTGSGKTEVLHQLRQSGEPVIDLEALASHKGSAFGGLGEKLQPTQEMFENLLAEALAAATNNGALWVEDESQRIGNIKIPDGFWKQMRNSHLFFLDIPFEERLHYLTQEYGKFDKEQLEGAITRIQKRLGGLDAKNAVNYLREQNHKECFRILLKYYDKCYTKGLNNRERVGELLNRVTFSTIDTHSITNLLLHTKGTTTLEQTVWSK